jgi:hypothetical protein
MRRTIRRCDADLGSVRTEDKRIEIIGAMRLVHSPKSPLTSGKIGQNQGKPLSDFNRQTTYLRHLLPVWSFVDADMSQSCGVG